MLGAASCKARIRRGLSWTLEFELLTINHVTMPPPTTPRCLQEVRPNRREPILPLTCPQTPRMESYDVSPEVPVLLNSKGDRVGARREP